MNTEPNASRPLAVSKRDPKALLSGLLFIAFGAAFLWLGSNYSLGTARQMGPGFFPRVLAVLLIAIGLITALTAAAKPSAETSHVSIKGLILIPATALIFAFAIREVGLALVVVLMVLIGALASRYFRFLPVVAVALTLSAFCVAVFVLGLGLPMPIFGSWFGM